MRNLKKALSLALAAVMVMGMMVVGASAASYKDADKIEYTEAVDVMSAVGMIQGNPDGTFNPAGTLTRAGAAKLIAYLTLGQATADKLVVTTKPFDDVETNAWFAGYVAYCADKGLLNGVGDNKFNPDGAISAYGFAKLLLGALGYDAVVEGMTGASWEVAAATLAIKNDLFVGNEGAMGSQAMTREEACLYAFNALKATMVEYENKGSNITIGDITINGGASKATFIKSNNKVDFDGSKDGYTQLCEALYPNLTVKGGHDDFGRPGTEWKIKKDTVAFAADEAVAVYAGADFTKNVINDLKDDGYAINAGKDTVTYNGDPSEATVASYYGHKGCTVELYANDKDVLSVIVTEAVMSKVESVTTTKKTNVTTVKFANLYTGDKTTVVSDVKADADVYALVEGMEKNDLFMGYYDAEGTLIAVDTDIDTVEGKIQSKSGNAWIKIDGEKYEMAAVNAAGALTTSSEGTFYLYNGYVVYFAEGDEVDNSENLAYVLRVRTNAANAWDDTEETYEAELLYADGTTEVVETEELFKAGTVVNYSVSKNVYAIEDVIESEGAATLKKGETKLGDTGYYGNAKTTFVVITMTSKGKFDSAKVYTGIKNIPSMKTEEFCVVADGTMAKYVFCVDAENTAAEVADKMFIVGATRGELVETGKDHADYYTYQAIVDGEVIEIMVAGKADDAKLNGLYTAKTIDEDGVYADLTKSGTGKAMAIAYDSEGVIKMGAEYKDYDEDVVVFVYEDGVLAETSIEAVDYDDANVFQTAKDGVITALYIIVR